MLTRLEDKTLRLFKSGDATHPRRKKGKIVPLRKELPERHAKLLDWRRNEYDKAPSLAVADARKALNDPVRLLRGLGKETWRELGGGERILEWLRSEDPDARPPWPDRPKAPDRDRSVAESHRTFWESVAELRGHGLIARRWKAAELIPFLNDRFSINTIRTVPANASISPDGSERGDYVKKGAEAKAYRHGRGVYELIEDPEEKAA